MSVILRLKDFSFTYPEVATPVLSGLNQEIEAGRCYCLTGPTGSGKTTLALALKGLLSDGSYSGEIDMPFRDDKQADGLVMAVGMVLQDPEVQLLTSTVGAEVAFGLENLCVPPQEMAPRVTAALEAVGLDKPLDYPVDKLSMGQKYRLLIAALMVMQPRLLILDEPGAQLDPDGLELLRGSLRQLKDSGVAILLCEHRPEALLTEIDAFWQLDASGTLADGRWRGETLAPLKAPPPSASAEAEMSLQVENLSFLGGGDKPVWSDVCFAVEKGRRCAVTGLNGTGKTTLLRCLAGFLDPQQGQVEILGGAPSPSRLRGRLGCLFQNPQKQIFENTVTEEVAFPLKRFGLSAPQVAERVAEALDACSISQLADQSPHKLSYGQKHLVALASVLASRPELLLLDDPLAGLDDGHSRVIMELLVHYNQRYGTTMLWTFHDPEAWPGWADQVLHLEGGALLPFKPFSSHKAAMPTIAVEGPATAGEAARVGLRMLLALTLSCLAFAARSVPFLIALSVVDLVLLWWMRSGQLSLRRELKAFFWQTLVILTLYLIRFQDLTGLWAGFKISWQLFLALLPGMVFVRTTSQARIVQTLNRVMPCRMAFVLSTCLKFAPHLLEEVRSIYEGQVLRGARILPRDLKKPWHWIDLLHCVVVPAVVQCMALAGNIALAARARDFGRQPRRTCWPGA